jgi:hypothetical protein
MAWLEMWLLRWQVWNLWSPTAVRTAMIRAAIRMLVMVLDRRLCHFSDSSAITAPTRVADMHSSKVCCIVIKTHSNLFRILNIQTFVTFNGPGNQFDKCLTKKNVATIING